MNNFAILRTKKIHTPAKIVAADKHNLRVWQPENANPKGRNFRVFGDRDSLKTHNDFLNKYDIKPRKNAVLAIEYITSFSPEMRSRMDLNDWVSQNVNFFKKHHAAGLMSVDLHLDESTPHLHITATPLVEKTIRGKKTMRLSARDFLGGKKILIKLQDDYARSMSKFGLKRGVVGSKARHTSVRMYYKNLNQHIEKAEKYAKEKSNFDEPTIFNYKKIFASIRKEFKLVVTKLSAATSTLEDQEKLISVLRGNINLMRWRMSDNGVNELENAITAANEHVDSLKSDISRQHELNLELKNTINDKDNFIDLQKKYIEKQAYQLGKKGLAHTR